jgi:serine/threonine-protein kinase
MSPEQADDRPPTPASDVFAFGTTAYELLAGARPFTGAGPASVLAAISGGVFEPLRNRRVDLPQRLVQIVERCLQREPAARFADGAELVRALEAARSAADASNNPSVSTGHVAADPVYDDVRWLLSRVFGVWQRPSHRPRPRIFHTSRDGMGMAGTA